MWFPRANSATTRGFRGYSQNTEPRDNPSAQVDGGCTLVGKSGSSTVMFDAKTRFHASIRRILEIVLCIIALEGAAFGAAANAPAELTRQEVQRLNTLRKQLCASVDLSCSYIDSIFSDPRLTIYEPPAATPPPGSTQARRVRETNPYLTPRFGLLTPESLERCRSFIQAHTLAFDAAERIYGVPREVICGHLRIETDFGVATALTPYPLGTLPAIDRLISLYIRRPGKLRSSYRFVQRQRFAKLQLTDLLSAAKQNDWDLFEIPGSSTGAIGLLQFEPSVFNLAVDGDGDGKIDLFNPEDAILSVAHYLVTHGWDDRIDHQKRAVYSYYGGHYDTDRYKYYMKAVLAYADAVRAYLGEHPIDPVSAFAPKLADESVKAPRTGN
jgi:membrane-bound lytic murein transglycosylase B